MRNGDFYKMHVYWDGGFGERIPAWANRVVQDAQSKIFSAQVWCVKPYEWKKKAFRPKKDPLLIFKLESVKLFDDMVNRINDRVVSVLMRAQVPELQIRTEAAPQQPKRPRQQYTESHQSLTDEGMRQAAGRDTREQQPVQPVRVDKLPGRNDPCPCGSGKKFKQCHGRNL